MRFDEDLRFIERSGTSGNESRIECVVLGPAQMHSSKRLDLDRLQHQHSKACRLQMLYHAALIAAGRLDADACHAGLGQVAGQSAPARQSVDNLPVFGSTVHRDVEFEFGSIDSSRHYASLCHLRRPCLVKRTKLFRQPSGSDEGAGDDHATGQPKAAQGGYDPIASGLPRMASAVGHSFRNMPTIIGFAITRAD